MFEDTTSTLFCGDLFTHIGDAAPLTEDDIVDAAMASEDLFGATSIGPMTAPTIRRLAYLTPRTLALMHGSSFRGDGAKALKALADRYAERITAASRETALEPA